MKIRRRSLSRRRVGFYGICDGITRVLKNSRVGNYSAG